MVKRLLLLGFVAIALGAQAQYQLVNSDFEIWDNNVTYNTTTGKEPSGWNSFLSATGSMKSYAFMLASSGIKASVSPSTETYNSEKSHASVQLKPYSAMGVLAQANLTNGCINMGSSTADEWPKNYNYTNVETDGQYGAFSGKPDRIHVWVKFTSSVNYGAKVSCVLHDNTNDGYMQDPYQNFTYVANDAGTKTNTTTYTFNKPIAKVVAHVSKTDIQNSSQWQEIDIPLIYDNAQLTPSFALVSFATSSAPGKGNINDVLLVDDFEFIYNSELKSATYGIINLMDLFDASGNATIDDEYDKSLLSVEKNAVGGTIDVNYNEVTALLTITVKGDNFGTPQECETDPTKSSTNYHTYTIQFNVPSSELEKAKYDEKRFRFYDGTATLRLNEAFDENKLELIPVSSNATTEYKYEKGVLTITVKGSNYNVDPTNVHEYTVNVIVKPAASVVGEPVIYEDDIVVTVNGESSDPQLATIVKNNMNDGTVQFIIKNFSLSGMPVGNITLSDVTINSDGSFSTIQDIQIEEGDDEGFWMGPMLTEQCDGSVPVVMSGKISDHVLYVTINIDLMDVMEQIVYVQFGYDFYTLRSEWGTICLPSSATLPDGVSAYTCDGVTNNVLDLDEVSSLAANTPYILKKTGTEASYDIIITEKANEAGTSVYTVGCLNGVLASQLAPVGSYVLQNLESSGLGFYQVAEGQQPTVGANRCYLTLPNPSVKALAFPDGTQTSISAIQANDENAAMYDLSGRRVSKATKGIYITNGKKVLVK